MYVCVCVCVCVFPATRRAESRHFSPGESRAARPHRKKVLSRSPPFLLVLHWTTYQTKRHGPTTTIHSTMATTTAAPRSGLDALASLASMMHESIVIPASGSPPTTDDDSEAMPPPPPRRRMRSASNPEGMERWEPAYSRRRVQYTIGIVEEDDADAEEELDADNGKSDEMVSGGTPSSPAVVISPESLLHRARSKLLQDMSEANLKGEKGLQTLPHSLNKYKHVSRRPKRMFNRYISQRPTRPLSFFSRAVTDARHDVRVWCSHGGFGKAVPWFRTLLSRISRCTISCLFSLS